MTNIKQHILNRAIDEAKKSQHSARMGAVIFNKSRIISVGHNFKGSRRKLHPRFTRYQDSIHAEVGAILNARTNLSGCSILVVRINKEEQLRLAKPCQKCKMYLDYVGIKNIYYSTSNPFIEKEK